MDMNILVSTDEKYLFQTCVTLKSLFKVHTSDNFHIFAMISDMEQKAKNYFYNFVKKYNHSITLIDITMEDYKSIGVDRYIKNVESSDHLTMATFNRLLLLSKECNKCDYLLYLDSDIIVNKPIYELYESLKNNPDKYASVVEGFTFKDKDFILLASGSMNKLNTIQSYVEDFKSKTEYPNDKKYFNAGVILFNLHKLKEIDFQNIVKEFVENHDCAIDCDQFILNSIFMDHVYWAPFIFNCRPGDFDRSHKKYLKNYAAILHYSVKPWNRMHIVMGWLWWKYAFLTDAKKSMKLFIKRGI